MKTTAKVFTIIGIVSNAISIGVMAIYSLLILMVGAAGAADGATTNTQVAAISAAVLIPMFIVIIVLMILGIVFGKKTLNKLATATCKSELIVWGILDLIFCNVVGGILILCLKDSDFVQVSQPVFEQVTEEVSATATEEVDKQDTENN